MNPFDPPETHMTTGVEWKQTLDPQEVQDPLTLEGFSQFYRVIR